MNHGSKDIKPVEKVCVPTSGTEPNQVTGLIHEEVSTPINIDKLETELENHPDRNFVQFLINGLRHGFDTGVRFPPQKSLECENLLSARKDPDFVTEELQREKDKGYVIGPFDQSPYEIYRVSPLGVATHKYSGKKRLIVDLSSPHGNAEHESINNLIDKDHYSLVYVKLEDAIRKIKEYGPASWLNKTDITDAFKNIPIAKHLWHLYGVKWKNKYWYFKVLVFGSRSSPWIFSALSVAVCWIATNNYGIESIFHMLDAFLAIDQPMCVPERTMAIISLIFNSLKIPLAKHKTVGPVHVLEYLGIILDAIQMEARLPSNKLQRIIDMLQTMLNKRSCTKKELLSLLGHLNFASRVIVPGRSFVSYLICLAYSVSELHHRVKLTSECQLDIHMWFRFLKQWNGVSFFLDNTPTLAADFELYTDAAATVGFGGYFQGRWFQGKWPVELPILSNKQLSMALLELYPIVIAAVLWGKEWKGKRIKFHCDNMATVQIITKGRSKVNSIMKLMRRLTWCSAIGNFVVIASHVPGVNNELSDSISRFQMERFRRLAPEAEEYPTPCPTLTEVMWY